MKILCSSCEAMAEALAVLRAGGCVAMPTDTLYGLVADALSLGAVERVLRIKGRGPEAPIPVFLADPDGLAAVSPAGGELLERAVGAFWPGPVTLVVPAHPELPAGVRSPEGSVGVRVPESARVRGVCRALEGPVTATSANPTGEPPPATAEEATRLFIGRREAPDLLLEDGPCRHGTPSTVVDLTGPRPRILREGALPREQVEQALGALG
jgi:tRNA threonylcarbamoyl adenosine modification protein (Sua5/YciO/YrdC/YwlC family)